MPAVFGRRGDEAVGRARHVDRLADDLDIAPDRRGDGLGDAEMAYLFVVEGLIEGVDRPARDPRLVQQVDPFGAGTLRRRSTAARRAG